MPPAIRPVNPIASGDSMMCGIAIGLLKGMSPQNCIRLGMACAAANAEMWEPANCSKERVYQLMPQVKLTRL